MELILGKSSGDPLLFFMIVGAIVAIGLVAGYIQSERRRAHLTEFGNANGLFFSPHPGDVHDKYGNFVPFDQGHSRRSTNLIHGQRGEINWEMFDYRYTTGSGKNKQTHRRGIVAARVPLIFKKLVMRPEGFLDKLASMVGVDDINFESEEFSRRFHVTCDVRKFAYDVIHPQMIEFLLACPARHWQLAFNTILIHKSGRFSSGELQQIMLMIEGFLQRLPNYLRQDIGMDNESQTRAELI